MGDLNGDGLLDMLVTPFYGWKNGPLTAKHGEQWTQCLSTGGGFEVSKYTVSKKVETGKNIFLYDFNGDGTSDVE